MTFPGMEKRWEFSVTVGTLYITSNVFIKKGNRRTNAKIPTFFPLDLTFIIPIYTIHIHTEKVSAWGEGRGHKALSETSSQEQVPFTSCVFIDTFLNIRTSNTITAQTIQSQKLPVIHFIHTT